MTSRPLCHRSVRALGTAPLGHTSDRARACRRIPAWSYSRGMTVRVGPKGQVVIPKEIRDRVGLHPGDDVDVELRDGEVVIHARRDPAASLGGRFAGSGMAKRLLSDRARESR